MTSVVSEFIIKTLCDNQGRLDFSQLNERVEQEFSVLVLQILFNNSNIVIQGGRQNVVDGQIVSPDSLIVAKTSLRLCQKQPGEFGLCDGLHLCRNYVSGNCTLGDECGDHHSLTSTHNVEVLKIYGLHNLTENQLFQLLLQNDPNLLPEICPLYNEGNGPHGTCTNPDTCTKLHICQHFLQGDCEFGASCERAHDVDAQGMELLTGFSQENIRNLHEIYRNKFIIIHQQEGQATATPAESFPCYWDKNALPDIGYERVPVSVEEWIKIMRIFQVNLPERSINTIQRIQNPSLWEIFQWQKRQMKKRNGGTTVNEQYLFHGTDESLIDAICEQNFDWRMCGDNGTHYGKGSYFAKYPQTADGFAMSSREYNSNSQDDDSDSDPEKFEFLDEDYLGSDENDPGSDENDPGSDENDLGSDENDLGSAENDPGSDENDPGSDENDSESPPKIMFVARVLVGEYTEGNGRYVRPPPKEDGRTLYDSCVDCVSNPRIYVVFEKQQIYPEYVINYS